MRKLTTILTFILLINQVLSAQKLDDYLKITSENNPSIKASYAEFEASMEKVPQVSSLDDPTLTASAFGQMIETRLGQQMARFTLTQMFPWFGTLAAKKDASTLLAESKFQFYQNKRNEVFYNVKVSYYALYELEKAILIQEENIKILESFKVLALSKFQNGKASMVDVIRTDIMLNEMKTEIQLLKDKRKPLEVSFNRLLNRADKEKVVIEETLSIHPLATDYRKVNLMEENPQILELDKKILSAEAEEKVAVKSGRPNFMAGLDYSIISPRTDANPVGNGRDAFMPMVGVSLPIFRKKYTAAKNETQFMKEAAIQMKIETQNMLQTEYEMSMYEVVAASKMLTLYDKQTKSTEQVVELLINEYSNSSKDFEDILMAQQQLLNYRLKTVSGLKEYHTAIAKLDYLTAKTIVD